MKVRVAILQPSYLPWLGYFDQIYRADTFVFYDDVQYDKHGWRNRNKIKTPQGWQWLTVPVLTKGRFGKLIYEMEIDNHAPWAEKHLKSIQVNYHKSPYYHAYIKYFEKIYLKEWQYLADLDIELIKLITNLLGMGNKMFIRSMELGVKGDRLERLINICQLFKADNYLTGQAARNYLDEKLFAKAGIKVEYQNYKHPAYPQLYGDFIPHLSVIDLLFNCGPESLKILAKGGEEM
jgi:hypothetical protein